MAGVRGCQAEGKVSSCCLSWARVVAQGGLGFQSTGMVGMGPSRKMGRSLGVRNCVTGALNRGGCQSGQGTGIICGGVAKG